MSFERSLDRHKDKIKYCTDAMALGFASWALPHVITALISAIVSSSYRVRVQSTRSSRTSILLSSRSSCKRRSRVLVFRDLSEMMAGSCTRIRNQDKTVEITAKGLDLLRLPTGTKLEMKKLVTTEELQTMIDVYVSPQAGIFNIKRGFREGGEGLEALLTELGDDILMVIPRTEMDTEATGLLKLSLRVKLTAEKEIEKKLQALCKDLRNDAAEIKGIPTKLASGAEARIIWSGDLGTARVRNGLTRAAAVSAEITG